MICTRLDAAKTRLLVLFALAICVRLLYILSTSPDTSIASVDAWGYHRLALNLEYGNGFSLRGEAPFVSTSVRTPLYPAFLWLVRLLFGPALRAATIVQAVLDGCTTVLVWWLAAQLVSARAGRVAGLLYALNPTQVRYVNELLTETLLSFLLTVATCALVHYIQINSHDTAAGSIGQPRRTWLLAAALFSGLATLCKPNAQFLPLIWLPAIALLHRHLWLRALGDASLLAVTIVAVIAPWLLRNYLVFGRPFLSTAFEGNISRVSAPAALAAARGQYAIPWSAEWDALLAEIVTATAERYDWRKPWDALTAQELYTHDHQVYLVAREVLRRHPGAWLSSHMQGMVRYLEPQTYRVCYARFSGRDWPPDILDDAVLHTLREIARGDWANAGEIIASERWQRLSLFQGLVWWGTFAGQLIGLVMMLRGAWQLRRRPLIDTVLLLTIAYVLWVPGPIAYERFRVPVTGLILVLVSAASTGNDDSHRIDRTP